MQISGKNVERIGVKPSNVDKMTNLLTKTDSQIQKKCSYLQSIKKSGINE